MGVVMYLIQSVPTSLAESEGFSLFKTFWSMENQKREEKKMHQYMRGILLDVTILLQLSVSVSNSQKYRREVSW